MDAITRNKRRLQQLVMTGRLTKRALSRASGISEATLTGMERDGWNPKVSTLAALVAAADDLIKAPAGSKARARKVKKNDNNL